MGRPLYPDQPHRTLNEKKEEEPVVQPTPTPVVEPAPELMPEPPVVATAPEPLEEVAPELVVTREEPPTPKYPKKLFKRTKKS